MKGQLTGMRGVYLAAAELSRLGFIASPTSRSALAADILVTDQACQRAFSVQVKTNAGAATFWLVGKHTPVSDTHVYVLVNLKSKGNVDEPEYFVVPSAVVKERTVYSKHPKSEFYSLHRKAILEFKDKWDTFGDPHAEINADATEDPSEGAQFNDTQGDACEAQEAPANLLRPFARMNAAARTPRPKD